MFAENLSKCCFEAFENNIYCQIKLTQREIKQLKEIRSGMGVDVLFIVRMTYICYWHLTEDLKINESSSHTRSSKKKG